LIEKRKEFKRKMAAGEMLQLVIHLVGFCVKRNLSQLSLFFLFFSIPQRAQLSLLPKPNDNISLTAINELVFRSTLKKLVIEVDSIKLPWH